MTEELIFHQHYPKGEHQDILIGPQGNIIWERPWQSNLIVNGLRCLLAALVMGDSKVSPLSHWAVGSGEETWDQNQGSQPLEEDRRNRTELFEETARIAISPDRGISFLSDEKTPTSDRTERLEIVINLTAEQIKGENKLLREFGLFAGGTSDLNSGILINHRIHPRIDMKHGFTLQRTLRLTF